MFALLGWLLQIQQGRGRHLGNRQHHLQQQQQQQQKAAGNSNRQHAAAQCKQQQPAVNYSLLDDKALDDKALDDSSRQPAMARAKNALDDQAYQLLLKNHIKSLDDLRFVHRDEEVVVSRYQPFLEECARKTSRISPALLQKAALDHFGCSQAIAHQFANAMANAFSFCFKKVRSATSGKKLSDASKAVLMAASGDRSEQCAVKLSSLQQSMGCNSSSISSSSTCFSVLLPTATPSESMADPPTDAADILAVYGCKAKVATAAHQPRSLEPRISVVSSQEVLSSQEVTFPEDEASKTEVLALVFLSCLLLRRQGQPTNQP